MGIRLPAPFIGGDLADDLPDDPDLLRKALAEKLSEIQMNFERLSSKSVSGSQDLGGGVLGLPLGTAEASYGLGTLVGDGTSVKSTTVPHGLGGPPIAVIVTGRESLAQDLNFTAWGLTATQFTLIARHIDGSAWSTTRAFSWLAIRTV